MTEQVLARDSRDSEYSVRRGGCDSIGRAYLSAGETQLCASFDRADSDGVADRRARRIAAAHLSPSFTRYSWPSPEMIAVRLRPSACCALQRQQGEIGTGGAVRRGRRYRCRRVRQASRAPLRFGAPNRNGFRVDGRSWTPPPCARSLSACCVEVFGRRLVSPQSSAAIDGATDTGGAVIRRHGKPRREHTAAGEPSALTVVFVITSSDPSTRPVGAGKPVLVFLVRPAGCSDSIRDPSQTHKHTVAVIPARYASTRIPGKALADIGGRPMIEHVYRRAAARRNVDAVIVATDDARIADAVRRFGGDVRMTSPRHPTGTDRLAEVAADLDCDLVVNVQGDEPLIEPDGHRRGHRAVSGRRVAVDGDASATASTTPTRPATRTSCKVVVDRNGLRAVFLALADSLSPRARRIDGAGPYKHIGLYVYRREFLLQTGRARADAARAQRVAGAAAGPRARVFHQNRSKPGTIPSAWTRRKISSGCAAC